MTPISEANIDTIIVLYLPNQESRTPPKGLVLVLGSVETTEIIDIVNSCKNKTSTDWNGIDMTLLKKVIDSIANPLTYICNLSFTTGIFPHKMKTAKVIPLYKAGDKHQFTNYRPVSLLCQFSKILEKLFIQRLDNFIEKHNLLTVSTDLEKTDQHQRQ